MAGILGIVDISQLRQSLGLSQYTIPSSQEVDKLANKYFSSPPTEVLAQEYKFRTVAGLDEAAFNKSTAVASSGGSINSLFYRKDGYSVGDLSFDLILSEDHGFESTISSHPVEEGADITDHIQQMLQQGNLRGLISNFTIKPEHLVDRDAERKPSALGAGRAGSAWEVCRSIWEAKEAVTIVTCLDTYKNVGIKSFKTHRDGETGDALEIEVVFQQMRVAKLSTTSASAVVAPGSMKSSIARQTAVKKSQGRAVGSEVTMDLGTGYITGVAK